MVIGPGVEVPETAVVDVCRRYHVKELAVFGSAARGDMRADSDIDLLVDFLPEARVGLLDLAGMMLEFSDLVGRKVDIAVKPGLKPRVREGVLSKAPRFMRHDLERLHDMLETLESITAIVGELTEAGFIADQVVRDAIVRRLTVVGEAASVPDRNTTR